MLKPYVYLSIPWPPVQRDAPTGARVALHYPELGRTVELETDAAGRYAVTDRPAPGRAGETRTIVRGNLADGEDGGPGSYSLGLTPDLWKAADLLARVQAGETVGASSDLARLIKRLRETADRMDGRS